MKIDSDVIIAIKKEGFAKTPHKCKICGNTFQLSPSAHYIARENTTVGITLFNPIEEATLYDAFDCPFCGCQNIIQERYRNVDSMNSDGGDNNE